MKKHCEKSEGCQFAPMIRQSVRADEQRLADAFRRGADTETFTHITMRRGSEVISRIVYGGLPEDEPKGRSSERGDTTMKTKTCIFRPYGQDEGDMAELTTAQGGRIQRRLDKLVVEHCQPPYYLYELGIIAPQEIDALLDDEEL